MSRFNTKIRKGYEGRRVCLSHLKTHISPEDQTLWFHCASLGEYEQGLPVFERLKQAMPEHKIVLTFFSPSGFEAKHKAGFADIVTYLPMDSPSRVRAFLDLVNPELVLFVKYEIWPNYLRELKARGVKTILISALFRPEQALFKWYGGLLQKALRGFDWIFTQNESSLQLLMAHGITNASLAGDTRFDRVSAQLNQNNGLDFMDGFLDGECCVVCGSTWPQDEALLIPIINEDSTKTKYVIAPHDVKRSHIEKIQAQLTVKAICYSEMDDKNLRDFKVLIVDTIGYLSRIYSYADIAFIGGAVGKTGLHNTLEAAVFGVPIIIGKHHQKFPEAQDMIDRGGMVAVESVDDLQNQLGEWINELSVRASAGQHNAAYVEKNQGAVIQIANYLRI